jgi:hypothetical protein
MVKNDVWEMVPKLSVPPKTKILKLVWAMKPKADGTKRVRLNAKGCSQVAGQHYDADNISSPVTNTFSIHIAFTIILMCGFAGWVVDVNGAFLLGEFKKGDPEIYMDTPEGMEKWYTKYTELVVAKLKKCMYGTKQAARYYYDKVVHVTKEMKCNQSRADPCLFFKWGTNWGLVMWLTWIDGSYVLPMQSMSNTKKSFLRGTLNVMT